MADDLRARILAAKEAAARGEDVDLDALIEEAQAAVNRKNMPAQARGRLEDIQGLEAGIGAPERLADIRTLERRIPHQSVAERLGRSDLTPGNLARWGVPSEAAVRITSTPEDLDKADTAKAGMVAGMAGGGIAGLALRPLIGAVASPWLGAAARTGAAAIEGAASGAAGEATEAGFNGGDVADAAIRGGKKGAVVGGFLGAGGEVAGAGARKLADARSLRGRTIGALEEGEATGALDTPEFKALPEGKEGYNQVADISGQKFTAATQGALGAARKEFGEGIKDIVREAGDKAVGLEGLHSKLDSLADQNTVNGVPVDEQLGGAIRKVKSMLTKKTGLLASGTGQEIEAQAGTLSDVLKTKRAVQDLAEFGKPATAENRPYRLIYKELASEAEAIDPTGKLGVLNKAYAEKISKLERANDIVYGRDVPEVAGRASAERTAAARLGRLGDDTQAGTVGARQLEELAAMDPQYAKLLRDIELKKAFERTRFGLEPRMSASPEKWGMGTVLQNLGAINTRVAYPALRLAEPMGGAAKYLGGPLSLFDEDYAQALARLRQQQKEGQKP